MQPFPQFSNVTLSFYAVIFFIKGSLPLIRLYKPKTPIIVPIITPAMSFTASTTPIVI